MRGTTLHDSKLHWNNKRFLLVLSICLFLQGKARAEDMSQVQYYSCKKYGHIANQCKKFSNYSKWKGHLITKCKKQPQIATKHIMQFQTHLLQTLSLASAISTFMLHSPQLPQPPSLQNLFNKLFNLLHCTWSYR